MKGPNNSTIDEDFDAIACSSNDQCNLCPYLKSYKGTIGETYNLFAEIIKRLYLYLGFHYFDHTIYKQKDLDIVYNIVAFISLGVQSNWFKWQFL
jgi:hypothetical protein